MIWVLMQVRKFSKIKENKFSDDARSGVNQRPWPVGSKWAREPLYQSLYFIYHILLYTATQLITGHQLYCWRARIFSGQTSWGPDTEIKIRFTHYYLMFIRIESRDNLDGLVGWFRPTGHQLMVIDILL